MTENNEFIILIVIMNNLQIVQKIQDLSAKQGGVITTKEIELIVGKKYRQSYYQLIRKIEKAGILRKYIRGVYVTQSFDPYVLFEKINPDSYISFEEVLSKEGMIGTGSKHQIRGVRLGRTRVYNNLGLRLEYVGSQKDQFFGYTTKNGISMAEPEKAFLDCAYYYLRGMKLVFDIYSDVNITNLDENKIKKYLQRYKNPKFTVFLKKLYEGYQK